MHRDGTGCSYRNTSFAEPSSSHYFLTFYKTLFSFSHMIANVSSCTEHVICLPHIFFRINLSIMYNLQGL